jgi:TfoX/Sxy family transcriptional regulator of competence genes
MFGEYALYCDDKVVGLICDDNLFIKITEPGKKFVGKYYQEGHAYPGAKVSMLIDDEQIEDHEWLSELIRITANNLAILITVKYTSSNLRPRKATTTARLDHLKLFD